MEWFQWSFQEKEAIIHYHTSQHVRGYLFLKVIKAPEFMCYDSQLIQSMIMELPIDCPRLQVLARVLCPPNLPLYGSNHKLTKLVPV